ncbi:hypothetical protein [Desertivirga xinjiangensis]|uniref:hypothetical protein n=1 Tax=Desertivirga xinjiangensis TaxID=539206 RepID=UPI002108A5B9|nr:hypothetical protein [Pedobacter xinjiangensis]
MRKYLLIIIGCLFVLNVSGQYNYYRLSAGVGLGINTAFADLEKTRSNQTIIGNLDYHLTPFTSIGFELQKGTLSGGDSINDPHLRFFKNSYMAFTVNGKAQLGQFVDFESSNLLYAIRGLYVGTGVGIIKNKMTENVRIRSTDNHVFAGDDVSSNIVVPINTGINFNILDRWGYTRYILNLNYQMNVTMGEGLDGYNDSAAKFKNQYPDFYSVFSAGIKICFGPEGLY